MVKKLWLLFQLNLFLIDFVNLSLWVQTITLWAFGHNIFRSINNRFLSLCEFRNPHWQLLLTARNSCSRERCGPWVSFLFLFFWIYATSNVNTFWSSAQLKHLRLSPAKHHCRCARFSDHVHVLLHTCISFQFQINPHFHMAA